LAYMTCSAMFGSGPMITGMTTIITLRLTEVPGLKPVIGITGMYVSFGVHRG
jgi:hypothetical protein